MWKCTFSEFSTLLLFPFYTLATGYFVLAKKKDFFFGLSLNVQLSQSAQQRRKKNNHGAHISLPTNINVATYTNTYTTYVRFSKITNERFLDE